ncbi:type II toxin-antitoxin system VapC family toxin [Caulobacter sp. FWC2]|uniref:type II toxin-antitoxin system VapC family toxin n=1 Tax=Caulobacter sp. FWC2 TaxID=69664 RepID=UPI000C157497|nr:PIN domain-containing protein [Caulobacter sp. FWC2]PIB91780.1 VapC toxin family PIN domain ribonuclease [Caulobacter sp. FWC2]
MILVDTSIWVDHLRTTNAALVRLLGEAGVLAHPFVVGELALGNLRNRPVVLESLRQMPRAVLATDDEVLGFIEANGLPGLGVGYIDVHLLASARLTAGAKVWTRDQRLAAVAERLDLRADPAA